MLHLIHLLEGALLLYYTSTWECLAIVLYPYLWQPCYCTPHILYYTPIWGALYCTIHLLEGILYCTILYYTLTWGGPAIVLVTGGGGRLSHFHQLSKLFYSILCPNMKIKKKPTLYNKCRLIFNYIHTTNNLHSMEQHDKFYAWVRHT